MRSGLALVSSGSLVHSFLSISPGLRFWALFLPQPMNSTMFFCPLFALLLQPRIIISFQAMTTDKEDSDEK